MKRFIVSTCSCLPFLCAAAAHADVWVASAGDEATDFADPLERISPDGTVLVSVTQAFGQPLNFVGTHPGAYDALEVDARDGSVVTTSANPPPGSTPPYPDGTMRLLKLTSEGADVWETFLIYPAGLAIDGGRSGVWVSTPVDGESGSPRKLTLLDAETGALKATVLGLRPFVEEMTVGSDGALWVQDWAGMDDEWVRLSGSTEELDGYDASAATGPHHERLSSFVLPSYSPIAVNHSDGTVWAADKPPGTGAEFVVQLSAGGDELLRFQPTPLESVHEIAVNSRDGSVWVGDQSSQQLGHFNRLGQNLSAVSNWELFRTLALDMTDESVWVVVQPVLDEWREGVDTLMKLDADGEPVVTRPSPAGRIFNVATYAAGPAAQEISIDFDPASTENLIAPSSGGYVQVALLSAPDFDPLQTDIGTLRFGPAGAVSQGHWLRDVNGDGIRDLAVFFRIAHTGVSCGDTEAALTGETWAGKAFHGADRIRTIRCPS